MRGTVYQLMYDRKKWKEKEVDPINTLQLFVTNKCNLRCKGCFYQHGFGAKEMSFENYRTHLCQHLIGPTHISKVTLLGGEPTLHPKINDMVIFNNICGLRTTIYTNGYAMNAICASILHITEVRISVYGFKISEKPIFQIRKPNFPITIVYMLRRDNVGEILQVAQYAEDVLGCKKFFVSSIRDIAKSGSYWKNTPETLSLEEYFKIVQNFVLRYNGKMEIHISGRGVIETSTPRPQIPHCRFGNIFPNGKKIICPFDICKQMTTSKLQFGSRVCTKNNGNCLLQKVVLTRK